MFNLTKTLQTIGVLALMTAPALAQPAPAVPPVAPVPPTHQPGEVQQRVDTQQQRINQGVASGQLTHHEAAVDESHLRADERQRNADLRANGGHLTPAEKAHLNHNLNHNSARIYRTKHNGATQPGVPPK